MTKDQAIAQQGIPVTAKTADISRVLSRVLKRAVHEVKLSKSDKIGRSNRKVRNRKAAKVARRSRAKNR